MAASVQSDDSGALCEINVTPMVDVLLSLLIIFMVATPVKNEEMPINIPQQPVTHQTNDPNATLIVTIDDDGKAKLGESPLSENFDEMVKQFKDNDKVQLDGRVAIDASAKVPYGVVVRVMSAAHESGVTSVGLASDRL
ncbi:MAG: biopolymer transporter ExbD [Myxococcales bacterium]|nr:biopolymer transporter ExbD [Myxococcales bacterium]MCB9752122.1 biopolymer transporter ExbD [Myxococcales bacterium]